MKFKTSGGIVSMLAGVLAALKSALQSNKWSIVTFRERGVRGGSIIEHQPADSLVGLHRQRHTSTFVRSV